MQLSCFVAHHLHLELFPAEHALLDQDLVGRRSVDAALDDLDQFASRVGDAPAGAAHGEARADDRGQADVGHRGQRLRQRLHLMRARRLEADLGHRLAEPLAVLGLVDRIGGGADHLDVVALEHAHLAQAERAIERRLAAHGRQQREAARDRMALLGDDLLDDLGRDRLDIGPVRHVRIGHDGGGIGIDEDDSIAFRAQRLAGLRPRIIELARLADDDRAGADDEDGGNVGPFGHWVPGLAASEARHATAFARKNRPSRPNSAGRRKSPFLCDGRGISAAFALPSRNWTRAEGRRRGPPRGPTKRPPQRAAFAKRREEDFRPALPHASFFGASRQWQGTRI